jgi:phage terminase small subunit
MMAKGRPPIPTALRLITNRPGHKTPINTEEPVIEGQVRKPRNVVGRAAEIWAQYAPLLVKSGVLKATDVYMMAAWCQLAATMERVGAERMHHKILARFCSISGELGMTPSGRTRIRVRTPSQVTPVDRFFKKD